MTDYSLYSGHRPQIAGNRHRRPPPLIRPTPPNFQILLQSSNRLRKLEIDSIITTCNPPPENSGLCTNLTTAFVCYQRWPDALSSYLHFWQLRLDCVHSLNPKLQPNNNTEYNFVELNERMKNLFSTHLRKLSEDSELSDNWTQKLEEKSAEIDEVGKLMKTRGNSAFVFVELNEKKNALMKEKDLMMKRVAEFKAAIRSLLKYLNGTGDGCDGGDHGCVSVFKFADGDCYNWELIYRLILRERRRLEDGLPIYACRQEILSNVDSEQITVLIGETGSGKSTQLVQYIADSGIAANGSIVCTQPRKIAAISLAQRVREESNMCYDKDNSVMCYPTFWSAQQFDSKVIYMTDHCLLQHYMNDRNLSGISCIIVDEAHERSLNTDLLLALLKDLLYQRIDLRLVIMSATADANQISDYFFSCGIFHVVGRNYPVDIRYVPCTVEGRYDSGVVASYVSDVVRMATEVHKTENEGTILAFLTSQMEIEWACENFVAPSAVALPLHGKLSFEEQSRVFQKHPGKRKVIFATNVAETSLTIPGVKYVIDSGMVKQSKYEPGTGMNILRVWWISQSSANQRAGRAGRTEPGRCYRLYSESDFESMLPNQEPEIRRVHLGVAVLRILALGIKHVQGFDFVDAPSAEAIDMATRNLVQLGAVTLKNGLYHLTEEGWDLVKLGIEPQLGKLILSCFHHRLGREGVVLAAVMANASSIFCRVGNDNDKQKADCLKVQFCHPSGDLFTLLSVYKEWEAVPLDWRNKWCWENSINAKTMRRCQDTVKELDICLKKELNATTPSCFVWNPHEYTEHDKYLKKVILSSLSENIAMYTGYDRLGYEVALTGLNVQLHPSCSLLTFGQKPSWVVFSELLSATNQYLICVTAFDFEFLSTLCPPPQFNVFEMESRKLHMRSMTGFGSTLLKRFCGKANSNLLSLVSCVRSAMMDDRIGIEVNVDQNEIMLFASAEELEKVSALVSDALKYEKKWMHNECMEKSLYHGAGASSVALFGAGAEIKHLELEKRCLTVDVYLSNMNSVADKDLLLFLEKYTSSSICAIHKFTGIGQESNDKEKWGRITFSTADAARKATELSKDVLNGSMLKVLPSQAPVGVARKMFSFPAVKAKVSWPRRQSNGFAIVKCDKHDVKPMADDFVNLAIGGRYIKSEVSKKSLDSVVIRGLDKELSEAEILGVLRTATTRRILDFFLVRGNAVQYPTYGACEEALFREISSFMPKRDPRAYCCGVQVFPPEPKDAFMRAMITFDGRLHLEAAKALEHLEGKVLPGCLSWQQIRCQQLFHSSIACPASVYPVIKKQVDALLASFSHREGVECRQDKNCNGSFQVRISANATKTVAELRRPLEELMLGRIINHPSLNPIVLQHLFSRDGINLKNSIGRETRTYVLFDKHNLNVRVFGTSDNIDVAQQKLIETLLSYHESKQLEIHLRGGNLPPNLMKEVVKKFGPELHRLKAILPGAEFILNPRRHVISICGDKELKQQVEDMIYEIAQTIDGSAERLDSEAACPICMCEVEGSYQLEGCGHSFCQLCLLEQLESAIRNLDSFPICCAREGCGAPLLLVDLRKLLSSDKLEDLFRASLRSFVASSGGIYRFCPSPDCPSVYRAADAEASGEPFVCGACYAETCTRCHLEYHPYLSCELYRQFKEDPDSSLKEWCKGQENVKSCPVCGCTIEKTEGCNHVECRCGKHICWFCLDFFYTSDDCYSHLRSVHFSI